jgi:hypothetical protein
LLLNVMHLVCQIAFQQNFDFAAPEERQQPAPVYVLHRLN